MSNWKPIFICDSKFMLTFEHKTTPSNYLFGGQDVAQTADAHFFNHHRIAKSFTREKINDSCYSMSHFHVVPVSLFLFFWQQYILIDWSGGPNRWNSIYIIHVVPVSLCFTVLNFYNSVNIPKILHLCVMFRLFKYLRNFRWNTI